MKTIFDQGVPVPLRDFLDSCNVTTAYELGWSKLKNGDLIKIAEHDSFELLITTDKNLKYQQNLSKRKIGIIVLSTTSWPKILRSIDFVKSKISSFEKGSFLEVEIPD